MSPAEAPCPPAQHDETPLERLRRERASARQNSSAQAATVGGYESGVQEVEDNVKAYRDLDLKKLQDDWKLAAERWRSRWRQVNQCLGCPEGERYLRVARRVEWSDGITASATKELCVLRCALSGPEQRKVDLADQAVAVAAENHQRYLVQNILDRISLVNALCDEADTLISDPQRYALLLFTKEIVLGEESKVIRCDPCEPEPPSDPPQTPGKTEPEGQQGKYGQQAQQAYESRSHEQASSQQSIPPIQRAAGGSDEPDPPGPPVDCSGDSVQPFWIPGTAEAYEKKLAELLDAYIEKSHEAASIKWSLEDAQSRLPPLKTDVERRIEQRKELLQKAVKDIDLKDHAAAGNAAMQ